MRACVCLRERTERKKSEEATAENKRERAPGLWDQASL